MVEAVIFDMDGLLVNSESVWREVEIELFSELGVSEEFMRKHPTYHIADMVLSSLAEFNETALETPRN